MTDEGPFAATEIQIERAQPGKPHAGKVLAAIQPHADDLPIFAGGLVLKLIQEGYTGYLIRTTNDDHTGPGTVGEGVLANERDNLAVAKAFGMKKAYDLYYRNHMLDGVSPLELRLRLIFLFRLLKVDTVICYDPWAHYEENPDHYATASAVEAACWMSGMSKDYPEHFDAGLSPHSVTEKYYFARGPQYVNRVVDISDFMDRKISINILNAAQGPAGQQGAQLRRRLTEQGLRLPLLGNDDETANRRIYSPVRAGSGRGDRQEVRSDLWGAVSLHRAGAGKGRRLHPEECREALRQVSRCSKTPITPMPLAACP